MLGYSIKNGCKYLYFHPKHFKITFKSNSHLMSISRVGLVNPSIPTFPNLNLTKTLTNLLVAWKFTEKDYHNLFFFLRSFMEAQNQIRIWRWFPVVAEQICQPQLSAISLWQKQWQIYLLLGISMKNVWNNHYLQLNTTPRSSKSNSYLMSICRCGPVIPSIVWSQLQGRANFWLEISVIFFWKAYW